MRCPSCTDSGSLACAGCKNVSYCSLVCQQTDWPFHKTLCKTFRTFQVRPSPEMRRVVVFPVDSSTPVFKWLAMKDMDGGSWQTVEARPVMGDVPPKSMMCSQNRILDTKLDDAINLCYDEDFLTKYTDDNAAVRTASIKRTVHSWRGPMLAYCGKLHDQEIVKVGDMEMKHYSDLVALLIDYRNESAIHKLRKGPKVQALRAHCLGEQSAGRFKTVMIPRMHPIFDEGEVSGISKHVGMPLLLRKDIRKKYPGPINHDHCISALTFMMLACDPQGESFGWAPPQWLGGQVPNTLVVRQDREPLETDVLAAFGDFCENRLQGKFEHATQLAGSPMRYRSAVQKVMADMAPERWSEFLSRWECPEKRYQVQLAETEAALKSGNYISSRKELGLD